MAACSAIPLLTIDADTSNQCTIDTLHKALSEIGFIFIKHPLIMQKEIDDAFEVSSNFFHLPTETKCQYSRATSKGNDGYVRLEEESLEDGRPPDLKECFNICSIDGLVAVQSFQTTFKNLYEKLLQISKEILIIMGKALKLEDPCYFDKRHQHAGKGSEYNFTTMRLLFYPPVSSSSVRHNQIRCGEHVDYGSITLLFQDKNGGLQVKSSQGTYIDVPYMEGTVLVNLGALMQQWTCDKYLATPHRVLLPDTDEARARVRMSIAFFVHPDNDTVVECIDGSNKYPPITAAEDIAQRFAKTFKY